jgi:hypothetical protein
MIQKQLIHPFAPVAAAAAMMHLGWVCAAGAETPEEVAQTYIRAMADSRLNIVADEMHPAALERFKAVLSGIAEVIIAAPADRKPSPKIVNALFGDAGAEGVKDAPARAVFVSFMSNLTTFLPQIREMAAGTEHEIIGHVDEGGNVTHVVFRATLKRDKTELTKMDVLSLKRDGDEWKVLLTDDMESLIYNLGQQLTAARPAARPSAPAAKVTPAPAVK